MKGRDSTSKERHKLIIDTAGQQALRPSECQHICCSNLVGIKVYEAKPSTAGLTRYCLIGRACVGKRLCILLAALSAGLACMQMIQTRLVRNMIG